MGLFALVAYGVGDILGAGIYALVGKIAGIAGPASWFAFGIALAVAALTAISYAELGRRFRRSGGEAYFCQQAFGWPSFALLIGWLVFCSGIVSLATVSHAFAGHFLDHVGDATPGAKAALIAMFLVVVRRAAPIVPPWSFAKIALFAVANTGLLNCIMASRLLYGMAQQRLVPSWLGTVHAVSGTPHWAIALVMVAAMFVALLGSLVELAGATSGLLLLVFCSVNVAFAVVQWRDRSQGRGKLVLLIMSLLAALCRFGLIGFLPWASLRAASVLLILGVAFVLTQRFQRPVEYDADQTNLAL